MKWALLESTMQKKLHSARILNSDESYSWHEPHVKQIVKECGLVAIQDGVVNKNTSGADSIPALLTEQVT
jgi:hypothetical protein